MDLLINKKCMPCEGGVPPLTQEQIAEFLPQIEGWEVEENKPRTFQSSVDPAERILESPLSHQAIDVSGRKVRGKKISREFVFKNFVKAVDAINAIADIAEEEDHHPDLFLYDYKKLRVTLWTHAIGGLSENDFVVAAKINRILLSFPIPHHVGDRPDRESRCP